MQRFVDVVAGRVAGRFSSEVSDPGSGSVGAAIFSDEDDMPWSMLRQASMNSTSVSEPIDFFT